MGFFMIWGEIMGKFNIVTNIKKHLLIRCL